MLKVISFVGLSIAWPLLLDTELPQSEARSHKMAIIWEDHFHLIYSD